MKIIRCVSCKEEDKGDLRKLVDKDYYFCKDYWFKKFYRSEGKIYCYNCDSEVEIIEVD